MHPNLPLETMSVTEKLAAMEAIWDSLSRSPGELTSPDWHREILADRARRLKDGKVGVSDWETAKRRLQELGR